jgi:hypothetical protein
MKAAAALAALLTASAFAQELPDVEVTPETLAESIRGGVDFLVESQNSNGSWGGPRNTKGLNIYAPVPGAHHAFRAGASGLALAGLLDCRDARPATRGALRRGGEWMTEHLPQLRRADQTTTYNVWGHAYGLRALTRLYQIAETDERRDHWRGIAQGQIELLNRYEDLKGGWGYLDLFDGLTTRKPTGLPTSFTTATVLLAMHEAREVMDVELDERILRRSLDFLERQRTPDNAYVYSDSHRRVPRRGINRPAGSLARSQACNAALRAFGAEPITAEVLETWADRFIAREGFLSIGRKRPVPHETHFSISGYFYYYGIFYFSEAAAFLPAPSRAEHAGELAAFILHRQENDGSWWDYPLYDYHQPYGTGYALLAAAWCRDQLGTPKAP